MHVRWRRGTCLRHRYCCFWQPSDGVIPQHVWRDGCQPVAQRHHVNDAAIVCTAHSNSGVLVLTMTLNLTAASVQDARRESRTGRWHIAPATGTAASIHYRSPCLPTGSHARD